MELKQTAYTEIDEVCEKILYSQMKHCKTGSRVIKYTTAMCLRIDQQTNKPNNGHQVIRRASFLSIRAKDLSRTTMRLERYVVNSPCVTYNFFFLNMDKRPYSSLW